MRSAIDVTHTGFMKFIHHPQRKSWRGEMESTVAEINGSMGMRQVYAELFPKSQVKICPDVKNIDHPLAKKSKNWLHQLFRHAEK
jgi:hypothetical protein